MRTEKLHGREITVYERDDWKTCIAEDFKPGDYLDEAIAEDLINCIEPHVYRRGFFQVGEPYAHGARKGKYYPLYLTFSKVSSDPEIWRYEGPCFSNDYNREV